MPVIERDVVLQGVDENGNPTIDLPVTRLGNIEDTAEVKGAPEAGDLIPIIDGADHGQMKKTPWSGLQGPAGADGAPGPKGEAFTYEDFTAEQLEALRGPQGLPGAKGEPGAAGAAGEPGKSAYQYAQEGGYIGTEAEFAALLGMTKTVADALPVGWSVTLTAAGWTGSGPYTQTVSVAGVRADEAGQLVQVAPASASREAWNAAGVQCTGQGAGTLAFEAREKPGTDISVYVILQEVGA